MEKTLRPPTLAPDTLDYLSGAVQSFLQAEQRPTIILSDFDYTLCFDYLRSPDAEQSIPQIDPEIIAASKRHHMIVATGRRALERSLAPLWSSQLLQPGDPVIAENGGVIARLINGEITNEILLDSEAITHVKQQAQSAIASAAVHSSHELQVKEGETFILARLRNRRTGISLEKEQAELARQLATLVSSDCSVMSSRSSVAIQHASVSKGAAFRHYLSSQNIDRASVYVVGLGDAENDKALFQEADLSVGFDQSVGGHVDLLALHGAAGTIAVLNALTT